MWATSNVAHIRHVRAAPWRPSRRRVARKRADRRRNGWDAGHLWWGAITTPRMGYVRSVPARDPTRSHGGLIEGQRLAAPHPKRKPPMFRTRSVRSSGGVRLVFDPCGWVHGFGWGLLAAHSAWLGWDAGHLWWGAITTPRMGYVRSVTPRAPTRPHVG